MSDDIELPLLDKKSKDRKTVEPNQHRSPFMEFLSELSSPLKYIVKYTIFDYICFMDLWKHIRNINEAKEPLTFKELPLPFDYFNIESKVVKLDKYWLEEKERGTPSYARVAYKAFRSEFFKCGITMFLIFIGRLLTTVILGRLIYLISKGTLAQEMEPEEMIMQGIYFAVLFLSTNVTNTHYWNYTSLLGSRIRLATVGFAYKKLQGTSVSSLQEQSVGKIINLLASDLNELDFGLAFAWPFILLPITLTLSTYVMWDYFKYFTLIGIAMLLISLQISNKISESTKTPRIEKNAISDERIKLSNEIIECIRLIKMYAWDKAFRKTIEVLREREFLSYLKLFKLQSLSKAVTDMAAYLAAYFMFVFFVLFTDGVLTPEKVYATLMILGFVKMWCIAFPAWGLNFGVSARVMQKRIEDVLNVPDVLDEERKLSTKSHSSPIVFRNYSAYWNKNATKPCLSDLNLTFHPGKVTAVIGKIGSGKSTFLLSMLKEIPKTEGELKLRGSIAYVEQEPIIFSGTLKSNILFGKPFDEVLYAKVIRASSLQADLGQFSNGDETMIGEKGVTLSGGQKARVSLARALYSNSDIYLLDDPLSALDSKVAKHVFKYAVNGELLRDKIVILVTHHISFAKEASNILVFDDGKVAAEGTYEELLTKNLDLLSFFSKENHVYEVGKDEETQKQKSISVKSSSFREDGSVVEEIVQVPLESDKKEFKEEETIVTFQTYKKYLQASGKWGLCIITFVSFFVYQSSLVGYARFMGWWAFKHNEYYILHETTEDFEHWPYIIAGLFITLTFFVTNYMKSYFCAKFFVDGNNNLHGIMLRKMTRTYTAFFDKTPIGSILNRFSNDLGCLDKTNWDTVHNVIWGTCMLSFSIGTVCFMNPYVLIPSVLVFLGLIKIRNFFAKASVETKRLDLMSRSPLYSEVSATLNGLLIIRVFQQGGRFIQNFMDILYTNSRSLLFMQRTQGVFGLVIDLWLYVLTVSGVFLYIYMAITTSLDPSLFGLAMVLMLDLCNGSSFVVKQTLQLDVNMQSAERVLRYCELQEEAPEVKAKDEEIKAKTDGKWPHSGAITFKNVSMKYGKDLDIYALKDLNFEIQAGSKVGVAGRTGAGKSSIIQALFRMVEIESSPNSKIVIDDANIGELGLELVRKGISIIPQTATIFTGTIRRNLDPFGEFCDAELWQVLEEVKLKNYIQSLEKQLETDMTVSNNVFSVGQKQLMCLARAILKKSKIIVLDEATANVDIETDNFIQEKISEKFRDCTVITIAHRLTTIANYDKILVLEKGSMVEYDHPYLLLAQTVGDKKITNTEGWFAKMVLNSGENMARRVFEIAFNHWNSQLKTMK